MARQPRRPLPLPKNWRQKVRSAAVHAIALARMALTTARYPTETTVAGAGLPPAGTTTLSRHTWTSTPPLDLSGLVEIGLREYAGQVPETQAWRDR